MWTRRVPELPLEEGGERGGVQERGGRIQTNMYEVRERKHHGGVLGGDGQDRL